MLPSSFEKQKIRLNRTKSHLILNKTNIISKNIENFAMEGRLVI